MNQIIEFCYHVYFKNNEIHLKNVKSINIIKYGLRYERIKLFINNYQVKIKQ